MIDVAPRFKRPHRRDEAGHAAQCKCHAEEDECAKHDDVGKAVERPGHLPHLGVDEQEGVEEEQQRQGPGNQRAESGELASSPSQSPPEQCADAVGGPHVDQGQQDDAEHDALDGVANLLKRKYRNGGPEEKECQFRSVDISRSSEGGNATQAIRQHPCSEQHGQHGEADPHVAQDRPIGEVECVEPAEQVADDQERKRSRPGVEYRAVGFGLHEVWDTAQDEPMFDRSQVDGRVGLAGLTVVLGSTT
jgi:hypothetical protein